ncbi:50S ribosomal protein L3 [Candidatus Peregrinibacteria bacterium CG_4_10_14_0_2_um_filter_43_11]|nr:MAG: 50S ribosomal protein L3 [Candidatus Peregrinibacteria bacterium CG_4_10_14_0_2_um_filter_43_11]
MCGIIGKKLGMSQIIQDDGRVIPVTFIKCEPNVVVQLKTEDKGGYPAIVLGFDAYKNPSKNKKFKQLKEFRVEKPEDYQIGQTVDLSFLKEVETVNVVGVSKGKGYQGVMKRHGFHGGPASHGSHHHREPGSIGTCAKPGRVKKGTKLPGHMGVQRVTLKDVPIMNLISEKNLIAVKGPIPGANNSYVYLYNR